MTNLRITLLVSLLFVGYLLFVAWQQDYAPAPPAQTQTESEPEPSAPGDPPPERVAQEPEARGDVPADLAAGRPEVTPEAADAPEAAAARGDRVVVESDVLRLVIDTRGGTVREAHLLAYPEEVDRPDVPVKLLDDSPERVFLAQSGLTGDEVVLPDHHATFSAAGERYALDPQDDAVTVPLTWRGEGVTVTKSYILRRGSYDVTLVHRVENASGGAFSGSHYRQLQRTPRRDGNGFSLTDPERYSYLGAAIYSPQDKFVEVSFDDMRKQPLSREITGGWAAMVQHYFFAAWIPEPEEPGHYYSRVFEPGGLPRYIIGAMTPRVSVADGASHEFRSRLYVGPKLQDELDDVAPGLGLTVDYGIFTILAQPLFWLLSLVHGFVGNWGWAIVVVTILIKLAFYKLTEAQYKSMAKLRKVQPRMQSLKERYGDDKQRLNQAMMELYKKEKVNPLGGCLPLLIQIPFLIAFYWVLLESVELRHAPWMLWITDLSAPDPYYILPLIMGASMFIQQKLTPTPSADPMQEKMMMILPLVFTVMFAFFQAGLVLYWTVNNVLSLAQQWYITRKIDAKA